jgi:glycosyltransferase involved in cell wall biosynthesis
MNNTLTEHTVASRAATATRAVAADVPLKAAIIMPLAEQRGGCETMLLRFLRENRIAPGVDYTVGFLEDGPMVEQVQAMGYSARAFPAGHMKELDKFAHTIGLIRGWLKEERAQIVMAWMEKGQFYAGPAAYLAGIPSVWWIHSIPKDQWMNVWATRLPCRAVFCVGTTAEAGQKTLRPRRETRVMGIGIELGQFDPALLPTPAEARVQLGLPADGPLIGMVARLQRWKGVHVFVEAAARVAEKYPDAHFVVVGGDHFDEPDYPAELACQIDDLGIADRVRFVGLQKNVPVWVQAMDVFVHASFNEPTGAVILEALALGKCVIAARTPGPMELANDEKDALFVEPGKPDLLAAAILRVLGDAALRARLSAAAPAQARRFGVDQLAHRVARGLGEFAQSRPPRVR